MGTAATAKLMEAYVPGLTAEYERRMKLPAEVERTSSVNIGSGSQANDVETDTPNKGSTYNRNSKRGTRLVRSS